MGDVGGRAQVVEGDPVEQLLLTVGAEGVPLTLGRRVREDEAGRDVVHRDAPRAELVRQLAGEPDLAGLRRRVRLDARLD